MVFQPSKPGLGFLMRATVNVRAPDHVSRISAGKRRYIPILGGSFTGEKLSGEVLNGGADWQVIRPDGSAVLHARYTLCTGDGALERKVEYMSFYRRDFDSVDMCTL